jgi:hypothetical protein
LKWVSLDRTIMSPSLRQFWLFAQNSIQEA